jgi:hypothetical protein
MASSEDVKKYLAYWFQLGKKVIINDGQERLLPKSVVQSDRYSAEFEDCWQKVNDPKSGDCYLEGTIATIQELLSSRWEISACARCEMPVPVIQLGIQSNNCTCSDLTNWPNNELPSPREPLDTQAQIKKIKLSLLTPKQDKPKQGRS